MDDGSTDATRNGSAQLCAGEGLIKVVQLTIGFGQTAAMRAGVEMTCGPTIVTMDRELQKGPYDIPRRWRQLDESYDLVVGGSLL